MRPPSPVGLDYREVLRNLRYECNMTQEDVADASREFLTKHMVTRIEGGVCVPNLQHFIGFCHAFDMTLVGLLLFVNIPETRKEFYEQTVEDKSERWQHSRIHSRRKKGEPNASQ